MKGGSVFDIASCNGRNSASSGASTGGGGGASSAWASPNQPAHTISTIEAQWTTTWTRAFVRFICVPLSGAAPSSHCTTNALTYRRAPRLGRDSDQLHDL